MNPKLVNGVVSTDAGSMIEEKNFCSRLFRQASHRRKKKFFCAFIKIEHCWRVEREGKKIIFYFVGFNFLFFRCERACRSAREVQGFAFVTCTFFKALKIASISIPRSVNCLGSLEVIHQNHAISRHTNFTREREFDDKKKERESIIEASFSVALDNWRGQLRLFISHSTGYLMFASKWMHFDWTTNPALRLCISARPNRKKQTEPARRKHARNGK